MELTLERVKWLDNLKASDVIKYSNGTISKIQEIRYETYEFAKNSIWIKKFFTEHGDCFDCSGKTILKENIEIWLLQLTEEDYENNSKL